MKTPERSRRPWAMRLTGAALIALALAAGGCDDSSDESPATEEGPLTLLPGVAVSETRARLAAQVGTQFDVLYDEAHRLPAQLVAVDDAGAADPALDQFTVLFRARGEPALGERTYDFEHPVLGAFRLFVTPSVGADGAIYYQAAVAVLLDTES